MENKPQLEFDISVDASPVTGEEFETAAIEFRRATSGSGVPEISDATAAKVIELAAQLPKED